MACTIDATAAGTSANAYATIAEGDAYHADHLYASTWDGASSDEKCRAIVMATRLLDYWFDWVGSVYAINQVLLWPRAGVVGPNGIAVTTNTIPARIRDATCEWARQLIDEDRTADSTIEKESITSLKAGPVFMTFQGAVAKPVPDAVMVGVSPFGTKRARSGGSVTIGRA